MASSKRFCVHGHDTWVVGRDSQRHCRECEREYTRKYNAEHLEQNREYTRKYNAEHREQSREYARQRYWNMSEAARRVYTFDKNLKQQLRKLEAQSGI